MRLSNTDQRVLLLRSGGLGSSQGSQGHGRVSERNAIVGNQADQWPLEIGGDPPNPTAKAWVAWLNPLSFDKLFRALTNIVGRVLWP
jgi:hypothetical protein